MNRGQDRQFDVVGIGNAIVDVLCMVQNRFLASHDIIKGIMQLVDLQRSAHLYGLMDEKSEVSGGSVANTIAIIAMLGGRPAFIGKVKDDHFGSVFSQDLKSWGVTYETPFAPEQAPYETGRSMIFVTRDGERSMNTYLGASEFVDYRDIDAGMIASAKWLHLEGYRLDGPQSLAIFQHAISIAQQHDVRISLALSDPVCVERHRDGFMQILKGSQIDLLLCNRAELMSLLEVSRISLQRALRNAQGLARIIACTDGSREAHISGPDGHFRVAPERIRVRDSTGAGDAFAAGFLFGLCNDLSPSDAAAIGHEIAAKVISIIGARPSGELEMPMRMKERL